MQRTQSQAPLALVQHHLAAECQVEAALASAFDARGRRPEANGCLNVCFDKS